MNWHHDILPEHTVDISRGEKGEDHGISPSDFIDRDPEPHRGGAPPHDLCEVPRPHVHVHGGSGVVIEHNFLIVEHPVGLVEGETQPQLRIQCRRHEHKCDVLSDARVPAVE